MTSHAKCDQCGKMKFIRELLLWEDEMSKEQEKHFWCWECECFVLPPLEEFGPKV